MHKKFVQSSLALTAAAALGLGGAFVAGPAAAESPVLNQQAAHQAAKSISEVNAFGFEDGTLHLGVDRDSDIDAAGIEKLQTKYGADKVEVQAGIPELDAYAANDLVGGAGYLMNVPSNGGVAVCSTGFSGWDEQGNPIVLTAGHCAEDSDKDTGADLGSTVHADTERPSTAQATGGDGFEPAGVGPVGTWGFNEFGSPVEAGETSGEASDIDFAVIELDDAAYNAKAEITDWTSAGSDDLAASTSPITKVGSHTEGSIKKAGRTTGLTEADVIPAESYPYEYMNVGGRWVHGFAVEGALDDPFSAPGDSGGGVFQGETAVGVISGGGPAEWNDGTKFDLSWVADLDHSLSESGIDFQLTDPNEEPPGDDDANADAGADAKDADADAGADAKDADADAGADAKDADADAGADAKDADADAGADAKDADAAAAADADAKDADADAGADGKEADADAGAEGDDASADADGSDAPEAPKVTDQKVDEGGQITGKTEANAKVKLDWKPASGTQKAEPEGSVTVTADAEGNFTTEAPSEAGEYAYTATATTDAGTSDATEFTVTVEEAADEADAAAAADGDNADADSAAEGDDANADSAADGAEADAGAAADAKNAESNADSDGSKDGEAPAERKISIEPKEIAASDFVKKDKGVQITVEGFEEGENVSLEVVAGPENVEGITLDETANENGVAAFSIYGTNASDPSAYLGKYDVQVTGANDTDDEKALSGSFTVVADEDGNGGGSDDGDGGDGGSDLPRTGAELTGLAAGAGLLVVGGAAVVLTMRRNKKN
ncbi:trypsin-like serine protease [Brevibacterium sp. BDJS002]|uniref:LPXTG cell wall anchor domain-containing protein n=1 Tax=Brevibacterium sp. BDJS002 TaxID=3020906 RepID=UPI0023074B86|nr:trypsin-like serine protease [Brevibacterium sp. BDJS002]WCE41693.1 trypsin-like serine protease [Brevibacterium sp. BDJS002]